VDLNALVADALEVLQSAPEINVVKELRLEPKLKVDRDQFGSVITNLLLNAREALGPGGEVRVETRQSDDWAIVSVADNGCGMSPAFLRSSLFRPFQTTKKKGLGIGMFQSKVIVEAHRGKIRVESEPGAGTTFRVMLPLNRKQHETQSAHCRRRRGDPDADEMGAGPRLRSFISPKTEEEHLKPLRPTPRR